MKGDTLNCLECGTTFIAKNKRHKFCRKACRNKHNRRKNGQPEPDFLKPKKREAIGVPKVIHQPTQEYRQVTRVKQSVNGEITAIENTIRLLQLRWWNIVTGKEKVKSIFHHLTNIAATIGGAKVGYSAKKDSVLAPALAAGGFLLVGNEIAKEVFKEQNQQKAYRELEKIKREIQMHNDRLNVLRLQNVGINKVERKMTGNKVNKVTAEELRKMKFESLFISGKYGELLGDLEPKFSAIVYGVKGSGKSTFAMDLANDMKNYGKVAYMSGEEGISKTLQNKAKLVNLDSPYLEFFKVNTLQDIKRSLTSEHKFLIIDSLNMFPDLTPLELSNLRENFNGGVVTIMQATKSGQYKGDAAYGHDVDIVLKVENGIVENEKNRYGGFGEVQVFKRTGVVPISKFR